MAEGGIGWGTIVGGILILVALTFLVLTNQELFSRAKNTFDESFDTTEAVETFKDSLRDDRDRDLIELEGVANVFEEVFNEFQII